MAVPNSVFRAYVEKLGDTERAEFIGNEGDLFYDPEVAALYLSDGSTAGGVQIGGGGGGSITGVTAGNQLNGGGTAGNVTLNLNSDIAVGVLTATTIGGSLIPGDPSYTLGTLANPWQELFVSNTSIFIGMASITATADNNISLGQTVYIGEAEITSMEGSDAIGFGSISELDLGDLELFGSPAAIDFVTTGTVQGKDGTGAGVRLNLYGGTSTDGQGGGQIVMESGFSVGGGTGGLVTIKSGEGATSGNIEIETGDADNTGNVLIQTGETNGTAGTITIKGGDQQADQKATSVEISGGDGTAGNASGGDVNISGGQASGTGNVGVVSITEITTAQVVSTYTETADTDLATKKYVDDNAGGGGVTQLVAGTNITLDPAGGTGAVTVSASGGATPGGSDTQIQFNNNGAFAGNNNLVWFDSIDTLEVNKIRGKSSEDMIIGTVDHLLTASGDLQLITGDSSIAPAGHILVQPGTSGGSSGNVGVTTISGGEGTSDSLRGGEVTVKGGDGEYGGDVTIKGGEASAGDADQFKTGRVFVENPILKGVADNGRFTFQYVDNIDTTAILYIDDVNDPTGYVSGSAKIFLQGAVENGDSTSRQFVELTVVRFGSTFEVAETHNIKAPSSGQTIFTYTVDDGGVDRRFGVNITNASGQSSITVKAAFVKFLA